MIVRGAHRDGSADHQWQLTGHHIVEGEPRVWFSADVTFPVSGRTDRCAANDGEGAKCGGGDVENVIVHGLRLGLI